MTPGRKFSTTASAEATRRSAASSPARDLRSRVTERRFRLASRKNAETPPGKVSAPAQRLDLDHVGAEVGQILYGGGPEQELREGRHPDALQRAQGSHQSTSCMMWSATQTSSPRWLATSILEMILSLSGRTDVIA